MTRESVLPKANEDINDLCEVSAISVVGPQHV